MGNYLADRRIELGYTQKEVAEIVGVTEATVSRWESGAIANMRRDKIKLLADALRTSTAFIMTGDDDNNTPSCSPSPSPLNMDVTIKLKDLRKSLGDRIKAAREQSRLTQTELGQLCGTTKQTIFKYETGVITNIPLDRLEKIASVLSVSPAYLIGWSDTPAVPPLEDEDERELLTTFRQLNDEGRERVIEYAAYLVERGRYVTDGNDKPVLSIAAFGGGVHQQAITKQQLEALKKIVDEIGE